MLLASIIKEQKKPQAPQTTRRLAEALLKSLPMREGAVLVTDTPPPDEDAVFRMSGLEKLCPRMYVLAMRDEIGVRDRLDAEKRWILGRERRSILSSRRTTYGPWATCFRAGGDAGIAVVSTVARS